jgi:hypothetical protein
MKNLLYIILIPFLITGCVTTEQSTYIKDGKQYGVTKGLFRDRWWNYYERGGSFSEGGFYEEAISDFKTAIKKRKDDQWRARSYGMHFLNYFPHRELGIIYYRLNRYEDAITELENSLGTAESAKAKYFLNRARKALLKKVGTDRLAPSLEVTALPAVTNEFSVTLSGVAKDDHFVSSVKVNDTLLPLELSTEKYAFKTEVGLTEGVNDIRVIAEDLTGKTEEKVLKINVDRRGPIVIVEDQKRLGGKIKVRGFLSDDTGIEYLALNGKEMATDSLREMAFEHEVALSGAKDVVILEARDMAGNAIRVELPIARAGTTKKSWPLERHIGHRPPCYQTEGNGRHTGGL